MPDRHFLALTDVIADVGIIVASVGALVFVVSYASFFAWRRTTAGRAVMYVFLALLSVALLAFLGRWVGPDYWGRELARPLVWWAVALAVARLVWVLWSNWRASTPPLDIPVRKDTTTIPTTEETS